MTKTGQKFQIGDIVCLNSGGPEMTVSIVYPDGWILCSWQIGHGIGSYGGNQHFRIETVTLIREAITGKESD